MPGGEISDETRMIAAAARKHADDLPLNGVPHLVPQAMQAAGHDLTPTQIRALAARAIEQAQQVSYLLGRLAGLLEGPGEPE